MFAFDRFYERSNVVNFYKLSRIIRQSTLFLQRHHFSTQAVCFLFLPCAGVDLALSSIFTILLKNFLHFCPFSAYLLKLLKTFPKSPFRSDFLLKLLITRSKSSIFVGFSPFFVNISVELLITFWGALLKTSLFWVKKRISYYDFLPSGEFCLVFLDFFTRLFFAV